MTILLIRNNLLLLLLQKCRPILIVSTKNQRFLSTDHPVTNRTSNRWRWSSQLTSNTVNRWCRLLRCVLTTELPIKTLSRDLRWRWEVDKKRWVLQEWQIHLWRWTVRVRDVFWMGWTFQWQISWTVARICISTRRRRDSSEWWLDLG